MQKINNAKSLYKHRKYLRNNATETEKVLWCFLKKSKTGYKFRRQHSICGYILDFYCPSIKLGIEVDGEYHNFNKANDKLKEKVLTELGIKLLRFTNKEIEENIELVLVKVNEGCIILSPPPNPLLKEAGE